MSKKLAAVLADKIDEINSELVLAVNKFNKETEERWKEVDAIGVKLIKQMEAANLLIESHNEQVKDENDYIDEIDVFEFDDAFLEIEPPAEDYGNLLRDAFGLDLVMPAKTGPKNEIAMGRFSKVSDGSTGKPITETEKAETAVALEQEALKYETMHPLKGSLFAIDGYRYLLVNVVDGCVIAVRARGGNRQVFPVDDSEKILAFFGEAPAKEEDADDQPVL